MGGSAAISTHNQDLDTFGPLCAGGSCRWLSGKALTRRNLSQRTAFIDPETRIWNVGIAAESERRPGRCGCDQGWLPPHQLRNNNQRTLAPGIQQGLKDAGLNHSDIWVSTKLWSSRHGSKVQSGVVNNLQELGLDYIDLMIMHFPVGSVNGKAEYDYVDVSSILLPSIHSETDLLRRHRKKWKSSSAKAKSATLASPTSTPNN